MNRDAKDTIKPNLINRNSKFILPSSNPIIPKIYYLPNIHKPGNLVKY